MLQDRNYKGQEKESNLNLCKSLQRFVNQKLNVIDADQDRQDNKILSNSASQENELAADSFGEIQY